MTNNERLLMPEDILKRLSKEDEAKRQEALNRANDAYYDKTSQHYKDNERYSWAVKTINNYWIEEYTEYQSQTFEQLKKKEV